MLETLQSNVALLSLIGLVIAIVISIWKNVNLGMLSLGLAYIIGHLIGGIPVKEIVSGFPSDLLITMAGVTFLFGVAQVNGTLAKVTDRTVRMVKGRVALIPVVLFFLAFILSSLGPGQISIAALVAAPSMVLASQVGIPPLLMALVVGNGAQAGAMSPLAPNGIVGNSVLADMGIEASFEIWIWMLIAHILVAILAYFLYGGRKLFSLKSNAKVDELLSSESVPFEDKQKITIAAILLLVLLVIVFRLHVGMTAAILGAILILLNAADEKATFKSMPWGAIMLVTGVSVMVKLMSSIGGMDLFASLIAEVSSPGTVILVVGFLSGIVSAYASTSGVIMPAFLPMLPLLMQQIGLPNNMLMPLIITTIVCGHLTDMSPLSTTGAVFISGSPDTVDARPLYKGMLVWGLSMSVVGAVMMWAIFTILPIY